MAPALPHSPGCRHAHEAPSFTELVLATDALDAVIGDTFGPGVLRAVQKQHDNPLDQDGHTAAIRTVLRRILAVVTPADQRAESRLLQALDRDWTTMTEAQRDKAISLAMGAIVDAGRVVAPRVGNVLEAAGRTHVTDTRGAITDRYALAIDPSFSAVDQKVLAHMASSQALFIRDAYGRRAASDSVLARRIAVAGVSRGLDSTDIGEAMTKAFRGTSAERSESYFRMVASVFMGRARSYATVTGFIEAQIELSEISSALVETTCDACRMLDGTVFSVSEQHRSFLDVASQEDPEEVKFRQPFVSKGKDADGEYLYFKDRSGSHQQVARVTESGVGKKDEKGSYKPSLSAKQLGAKGVSTPPFHGHCLCLLIPAGLETVQQASSAARAGRPTEVPVGPKAPSVPAPPGEGVAPERAPRRRRTPADPPTLDRLPTRSGRFTVDLSLLDAAPYSNFVPGRVESIRDALDRGKKLPPIQIVVDASGRLSISDGNHRLRVYRERGVGPVPVDFAVWRTAGSWALREERARRRAQGDTAVPAIAPSAPPVKPPKAPPAPPVAPPTPAPKPPKPAAVEPAFDDLARVTPLTSIKTPKGLGQENVNPVFTARLGEVPVYVKPGHVHFDPEDAVARHRAVMDTARALGVGEMVMPAAMVRSESALREAGQIAPELLGEKHSVSPTMFVTRSAPPGAVPAYAQDPKALSKVRESDRLAGALIDFLHANSDRHDGNVLVDERGRVVLIDHDLTADTGAPSSVFFPGGGLEYSQRQSRLADLPKTAREYVSKIAGMDVDALSESFSLSNDAAATMKKRAQSVVHDGLDAALVKHEAWWQLVAPKASEERMGDVVAR